MIVAEIPFQCPQCDRSYRMKVDLLKLTRLNRIAVCGRCRHQFNVTVHVGAASEDHPDIEPPSSPIRLTPSHIPLIDPPTPTPIQEPESAPPVSGPYRAEEEHSPPPFSRPSRRTGPAAGWPQSDAELPSAASRDSKWPGAASPRLGWSKRPSTREHDTEPSLPRAEHDTEPASMPTGFELELDLPVKGRRTAKKNSDVRPKRKEIVVEVGDRKGKRRRRNTYSPESLVTEPNMVAPRVEGDDER